MAIQFQVNEHKFELDAAELRNKVVPLVEEKLKGIDGMGKTFIKSAVATVMGFLGIEKPDNVDALTHAATVAIDAALSALETHGLTIQANELPQEAVKS